MNKKPKDEHNPKIQNKKIKSMKKQKKHEHKNPKIMNKKQIYQKIHKS